MNSSRGCLSVIYDERTRDCRLSRYNQDDTDLVFDAGFDYFESLRGDRLMHIVRVSSNAF